MFKKILLPLDLTDRHAEALRIAAGLASKHGEITLLHVVEVIPGLSREEEPTFYNRLERKAASHLERLGSTIASEKVPVRAEVVFGDRVREVVEYATKMAADVIVLTSQRLTPEHPTSGLGSLSYRIGVLCNCPVLLVK